MSRAGAVASLVGGCREDSKWFIPVSVVCRESVSHASRTGGFSRSRMRCCVERMCGCVCVLVYVWVLIKKLLLLLLLFTQKTESIMRYTELQKMFATTCDVHKPP